MSLSLGSILTFLETAAGDAGGIAAQPTTIGKIETAVTDALTLASALDPGIAPFVVVGKLVASYAPTIVTDVEHLLTKAEPTPEDIAALLAGAQELRNPGAIT